MAQTEEALSFLKASNGAGSSVYDHLQKVVERLVTEKPDNAHEAFESLSIQVKQGQVAAAPLKELPATVFKPEEEERLLQHLNNTRELIKPSRKPRLGEDGEEIEDDDEEEEDEEEDDGLVAQIPDLMENARLLEFAGVKLAAEETYKLLLSVRNLAASEQLASVRFFGRIFGTERDYFIVEAKLGDEALDEEVQKHQEQNVEPPEPEEDEDGNPLPDDIGAVERALRKRIEAPGTGANEFAYFAANSVSGPWTRLPMLRPEQVTVARKVRRFFTGDLTRDVGGFPRFAWGEASLLRCQIARIAAATVVSPAGFYAEDADAAEEAEDGDQIPLVESEEFEGAAPGELLSGEGWVHHRAQLLNQGRCSSWQNPDEEDEDADADADADEDDEDMDEAARQEKLAKAAKAAALKAALGENATLEAEESAPQLRALVEDEDSTRGVKGPVWAFRANSARGARLPHAVVSAHSLIWPGAVAVAKGKQFTNVYVGYGQRCLGKTYTPPAMPTIQSEFIDRRPDDEEDEDAEDEDEAGIANGEEKEFGSALKKVLLREQEDPLPPPKKEESEENEDRDEDEDGDGDDDEEEEDEEDDE